MPPDAAQGKQQIASLIREAIDAERAVQFVQAGMPEPCTLIPTQLYGNFVQGIDPIDEGYVTHNINLLTWARLL